jgi:hypothetical protein
MASGCSLKVASPPQGAASVAPVAESTDVTVPLPAQTPFDGNPKAKVAYLEYYAMAYRKYGDLFEIDAVPEPERRAVAEDVVVWVLKNLRQPAGATHGAIESPQPGGGCGSCS